jgi:hypothetical protein
MFLLNVVDQSTHVLGHLLVVCLRGKRQALQMRVGFQRVGKEKQNTSLSASRTCFTLAMEAASSAAALHPLPATKIVTLQEKTESVRKPSK